MDVFKRIFYYLQFREGVSSLFPVIQEEHPNNLNNAVDDISITDV